MMSDQEKMLQEMQSKFPYLPEYIVKACMFQHSFDREKCFLQLTQEQARQFNQSTGIGNQSGNQHQAYGTPRRTSYPLYINGGVSVSGNGSQHSAPASQSLFVFENSQNQSTTNQNFEVPRIPSPSPQRVQESYSHIGASLTPVPFGHTRLPPKTSQQSHKEPPVTHPTLKITIPGQAFQNANIPRFENQISTLEISPGVAPFKSSQFCYYSGPSVNQPTANSHPDEIHKTSVNVHLPSSPKHNLTTQIFVETSNHEQYSTQSSFSKYQEPVLLFQGGPSGGAPDRNKRGLPVKGPSQPARPPKTIQQEQDELAYTQALLKHQRDRHDLLCKELSNNKDLLKRMKFEVLSQEQEFYQRMSNSSEVVTAEENRKLCDEIRKLRVECHCMSMEVDLQNSNQVPLGVTDENFYQHIFPGQAGQVVSGTLSAMLPAIAVGSPPPMLNAQNPAALRNGNGSHKVAEETEVHLWKCTKCTFDNHPSLTVCEMCEIPRASASTVAGCSPAN